MIGMVDGSYRRRPGAYVRAMEDFLRGKIYAPDSMIGDQETCSAGLLADQIVVWFGRANLLDSSDVDGCACLVGACCSCVCVSLG